MHTARSAVERNTSRHWRGRCAGLLATLLTLVAGPAVQAEQLLFAEADLLDIRLSGPISDLVKDAKDRRRYPLTLEVGGRSIAVEGRIRGKSRAEVCTFPPLRIYFVEQADIEGTVFEGQESLKLVTHCYNTAGGDKNVRKEYAAYRIFNELTESSYQARLARIQYTDDEGNLPAGARERFGAFIERRTQLAQRLGGEKIDSARISKSELDGSHTALVYAFQHLIGNTDWATSHAPGDNECCHNLDVVRVDGKLRLVPFDYDLSGIVDAAYARDRPGAVLVREERRRSRVFCADRDEIAAAIDRIVERRDAIDRAIAETPGASDKEIARMQRYVARFYRAARKKDSLVKRIDQRCV